MLSYFRVKYAPITFLHILFTGEKDDFLGQLINETYIAFQTDVISYSLFEDYSSQNGLQDIKLLDKKI
jgi:hypothetical protein